MYTDKIMSFLKLVGEQIRWKKAQPIVVEEIQNHIEDLKNALIDDGLDEDQAIDQAIKEMGDPVVIGEQLNRVHKPKPDWAMLILICGILLLGLVIQYYCYYTRSSVSDSMSALLIFQKHILSVIIGMLLLIVAYFIDFTIIGKHPKTIFTILYIACIYYILRGNLTNGQIQDTIYPLLLFPTAFAGLVYSMRNKGYIGILICGIGFFLPASIALFSPNMTMLFFLCISCLIILTSSVIKGWFRVSKLSGLLIIYVPTVFTFFAMFYGLLSSSWRRERISVFLSNDNIITGPNWLSAQIQLYLSHAKLIGIGSPIDQSIDAVGKTLPAIHTHHLLTYIIYNFGWIAFAGIILLLSTLIIRGIILSRKQKSVLGYLISISVITTFTMQCILYISVNLGFIFFSPLSLPLISFGGKYLVVNLFLLGLLLSVFRTGDYVRDSKTKTIPGKLLPFIQYEKGTIHINLKSKTIK